MLYLNRIVDSKVEGITMDLDRDFILTMIENISKSFKDTDPDFSAELDRLIENPDVDLTYLKTKLAEVAKSYDLPESVVDTITSLNNGINVLIQKEEDHKILEQTAELQLQQEQVDIHRQIEEQKIEEAKIEQQQLEKEEVLEEKSEEEIQEEIDMDESVEKVETVSSAKIEMGPYDTIESMASKLMDLASQGILATAVINGMEVSNDKFSSMEQFKEGYYRYQLETLIQKYNEKASTRMPGQHTDMVIYSPEGEDNKRIVIFGNIENEGLNRNNSETLEFTDGKDFDQYIMRGLVETFAKDGQEIKDVEDEQKISRGSAVTNASPVKQDRYRYYATMTNDNRLALNMAADSIEQAKMYLNGSTVNEIKREDVEQIQMAEEHGMEREKAVEKVKKMAPPPANGFVSGIGIGLMAGLSIIGNIVVLYLLKIIG